MCRAVCVDTLRHVLLATDLSKHASAAERAAIELSAQAQGVDCLAVLTPEAIDAVPALPLTARAALDALVARIDAVGGRGEELVLVGDPHELIARVAHERDCSLIVCLQTWPALGAEHGDRQHRAAPLRNGGAARPAGATDTGIVSHYRLPPVRSAIGALAPRPGRARPTQDDSREGIQASRRLAHARLASLRSSLNHSTTLAIAAQTHH